jgi:hypothetical protein
MADNIEMQKYAQLKDEVEPQPQEQAIAGLAVSAKPVSQPKPGKIGSI